MNLHSLIVLTYWIHQLVSADVCPHPSFMTPDRTGAILLIKRPIIRVISCTQKIPVPKDVRIGLDHQTGPNSTSRLLVRYKTEEGKAIYIKDKNNTACLVGNKSYESPVNIQNTTRVKYPKFDIIFSVNQSRLSRTEEFLERNIFIERGTSLCFITTLDEIVPATIAKIYKLNPTLKYALFSVNGSDNFLLRILDEKATTKENLIFWKTNTEMADLAFISINDSIPESLPNGLSESIPYKLTLLQMWLDCKIQKTEMEVQDVNIYLCDKYSIIILLFIIWHTLWYIVGVTLNFFTLRSLKPFRRKTSKYMWCCLSQVSSLSTVCDTFLSENELLHEQLYLLIKSLHSADRKIVIVSRDNRKSEYKYDYARVSGYLELMEFSNRPSPIENVYEKPSALRNSDEYLLK